MGVIYMRVVRKDVLNLECIHGKITDTIPYDPDNEAHEYMYQKVCLFMNDMLNAIANPIIFVIWEYQT